MDNKKLKITALCLGYSFFLLHFSFYSLLLIYLLLRILIAQVEKFHLYLPGGHSINYRPGHPLSASPHRIIDNKGFLDCLSIGENGHRQRGSSAR